MRECEDCVSFTFPNENGRNVFSLRICNFFQIDIPVGFVKQIGASTLGSLTTALVLNPINVVKIRLQNADMILASPPTIKGTISSIIKKDGILGFWAGVRIAVFQAVPSTTIYMYGYESIKSILNNSESFQNYRVFSSGVAASAARIINVSIMCPIELMKTMQAGGLKMPMNEIAKMIYKESGLRGFYRGWSSTVLRDTPYSGIYWLTFEFFRPYYSRFLSSSSTSSNTNMNNFLSGASAGIIAAMITQPFDVVKTKQQLYLQSRHIHHNLQPLEKVRSIPLWGSLVSLYKTDGLASLYRGFSMRLATVIPGGAIMVTVYEAVKRIDHNL